MVLKNVLSGETGAKVEKLQQEEAILYFEVWKLFFADKTMIEGSVDRTTQNNSGLVVW